ncbi:hypothetical protein AVEN_120421-1 [Araneus ventricosus]|uniref:Uncharacterized protein n=1 Tax=Araneus ventricosus TaxID=182803 RepID=A0A4Y2KYN0_ARAVE|nr:hypothetical protein AVEN_120421-1 [Araneus ventricosus]
MTQRSPNESYISRIPIFRNLVQSNKVPTFIINKTAILPANSLHRNTSFGIPSKIPQEGVYENIMTCSSEVPSGRAPPSISRMNHREGTTQRWNSCPGSHPKRDFKNSKIKNGARGSKPGEGKGVNDESQRNTKLAELNFRFLARRGRQGDVTPTAKGKDLEGERGCRPPVRPAEFAPPSISKRVACCFASTPQGLFRQSPHFPR